MAFEEQSNEAPNRRRSSFFERRLSLPVAPEPIESSTSCSTEKIKILYKERLENEYQAWKTFSQQRKARKRKLEESDTNTPQNATPVEALSEDVCKFMEMKPDIAAIKRDSIQFCKDYKVTMQLYNECKESDERIIKYVQNFVKETKRSILDKSIVDSRL